MAVNDLAGGGDLGSFTPEQLFAGDAPIHTDAGISAGDISKYEVVKRTAGVTLTRTANTGSDTGKDYVIAAQPAVGVGVNVPYFDGGHFNHAALVWPANLSTLALRKAFFQGTPIFIGKIS